MPRQSTKENPRGNLEQLKMTVSFPGEAFLSVLEKAFGRVCSDRGVSPKEVMTWIQSQEYCSSIGNLPPGF